MIKHLEFIIFDDINELSYDSIDSALPTPRCVEEPLGEPATQEAPSLLHKSRSIPFSMAEDQTIQQLAQCPSGKRVNWQDVAQRLNATTSAFAPRKPSQLYQRWNRVLNPAIRKGQWSPQEDQKLQHLIQSAAHISYSQIAQEMGDRTDIQVRYRIQNQLQKWIASGGVSQERVAALI